jgi:hypothetical protein
METWYKYDTNRSHTTFMILNIVSLTLPTVGTSKVGAKSEQPNVSFRKSVWRFRESEDFIGVIFL